LAVRVPATRNNPNHSFARRGNRSNTISAKAQTDSEAHMFIVNTSIQHSIG
jgi:hypothetical protein